MLKLKEIIFLLIAALSLTTLPIFSQMNTEDSITWSFHQVSSDNKSFYSLEENKNTSQPMYYDLVSLKPLKNNGRWLKRAYLERGNQYFAEAGKIYKKYVDQPIFDSKSNITSLHVIKNKLFFTTAHQALYVIDLSDNKNGVAKKINLPDIQYIKVETSNPSQAVIYCEKPKTGIYEMSEGEKKLLLNKAVRTFLVAQKNIYYVDDIGSVYAYDKTSKKTVIVHQQFIDFSTKPPFPEQFILGVNNRHLYLLKKTEHSLVGRKFDLNTLKEVERDWNTEFFDNFFASDCKWLSNENALLYIEDDGNAMYKYNFITGQQTYLINPNKDYLNMKHNRKIECFVPCGPYACIEDGYLFKDQNHELLLVDFTSNKSIPVKELLQNAYPQINFLNADLEYSATEPFSNSYLTIKDRKTNKQYGLTHDFKSPYNLEVQKAMASYEARKKKPPYRMIQKDGFVYFYTLDKNMSMAKLNASYSLKTGLFKWY